MDGLLHRTKQEICVALLAHQVDDRKPSSTPAAVGELSDHGANQENFVASSVKSPSSEDVRADASPSVPFPQPTNHTRWKDVAENALVKNKRVEERVVFSKLLSLALPRAWVAKQSGPELSE